MAHITSGGRERPYLGGPRRVPGRCCRPNLTQSSWRSIEVSFWLKRELNYVHPQNDFDTNACTCVCPQVCVRSSVSPCFGCLDGSCFLNSEPVSSRLFCNFWYLSSSYMKWTRAGRGVLRMPCGANLTPVMGLQVGSQKEASSTYSRLTVHTDISKAAACQWPGAMLLFTWPQCLHASALTWTPLY